MAELHATSTLKHALAEAMVNGLACDLTSGPTSGYGLSTSQITYHVVR